MTEYLLAGRQSELERLQLQARVWNPSGDALLSARLDELRGSRVLDVGCGALGWLTVLSRVACPGGRVVGTDVDLHLLDAARATLAAEGIENVELVEDDLFASRLDGGFDLVHARFQLAPLGRAEEQLASYRRLLREGGLLVLEEPDASSWRFNPPADAAERLIALILDVFAAGGGDFSVGRRLFHLVRDCTGSEPELTAAVIALPPAHPYLRLPLQFAASLRPRLLQLVDEAELNRLEAAAAAELDDAGRWGTTFTLVQAVARL